MKRIPIRTIRNEDDIFNQTPLPEWNSLDWIESASSELGCLWESAKAIFDGFYNNEQFVAFNRDMTPDPYDQYRAPGWLAKFDTRTRLKN